MGKGERREDKVQDEPEIPCTRKYGSTQRMMGIYPKETSLQALPWEKLECNQNVKIHNDSNRFSPLNKTGNHEPIRT